MNLREHFERLHPVPECVAWFGNCYCAKSNNMDEELEADRYDEKWHGFQSGRLFGLDEAREFTSKHEYAGEIAIEIDAAKEPK